MGTRYYIVDAVCGHVGRNNGIIKSFAVHAQDGKQAASLVKSIPRVKHDYKYVIQRVQEVSFYDFIVQIMINEKDPYLHVSNRQEQDAFREELCVFPMEDLDKSLLQKRRKKRRVNLQLYDLRHMVDNDYKAVC